MQIEKPVKIVIKSCAKRKTKKKRDFSLTVSIRHAQDVFFGRPVLWDEVLVRLVLHPRGDREMLVQRVVEVFDRHLDVRRLAVEREDLVGCVAVVGRQVLRPGGTGRRWQEVDAVATRSWNRFQIFYKTTKTFYDLQAISASRRNATAMAGG